jgi:hypothetical protein
MFGAAAPTGTPTPTKDASPWAADVKIPQVTERQLAIRVLRRQGATELEAFRILEASPGATGTMRDAIAAERSRIEQQAEREARVRFLQTPEGRDYMAQQALATERAFTERAAAHRALLRTNGVDDRDYSDAEVVELTNTPSADAWKADANDYAANIAAANGGDAT